MATRPRTAPLAALRPLVDDFAGRRILVWGDLVADCFLHGSTTRVSREAPALVLRYEGEEIRPGGAGNAALNAAALGARVTVFGCVGADAHGQALLAALEAAGIDVSGVLVRESDATPAKTRVMAGGQHTVRQQILRIDNEHAWPDAVADELADALVRAVEDADGVLISDYGLGAVSPEGQRRVREATVAAEVPLTLDSRHRLLEYSGVTVATPNEVEVEAALHRSINGDLDAIERAGAALMTRLDAHYVLITRGSEGMAVFEQGADTLHLPIHGTDEIADVTGAGDTVIATVTVALAAGAPIGNAARLANVAAGLVVLKHGTATVAHAELMAALGEPS